MRWCAIYSLGPPDCFANSSVPSLWLWASNTTPIYTLRWLCPIGVIRKWDAVRPMKTSESKLLVTTTVPPHLWDGTVVVRESVREFWQSRWRAQGILETSGVCPSCPQIARNSSDEDRFHHRKLALWPDLGEVLPCTGSMAGWLVFHIPILMH